MNEHLPCSDGTLSRHAKMTRNRQAMRQAGNGNEKGIRPLLWALWQNRQRILSISRHGVKGAGSVLKQQDTRWAKVHLVADRLETYGASPPMLWDCGGAAASLHASPGKNRRRSKGGRRPAATMQTLQSFSCSCHPPTVQLHADSIFDFELLLMLKHLEQT